MRVVVVVVVVVVIVAAVAAVAVAAAGVVSVVVLLRCVVIVDLVVGGRAGERSRRMGERKKREHGRGEGHELHLPGLWEGQKVHKEVTRCIRKAEE